jgi:hypothetical protein
VIVVLPPPSGSCHNVTDAGRLFAREGYRIAMRLVEANDGILALGVLYQTTVPSLPA